MDQVRIDFVYASPIHSLQHPHRNAVWCLTIYMIPVVLHLVHQVNLRRLVQLQKPIM